MPPAPTPAPRPGWYPDELRFAGRENLDPEHVSRYDAKEDAGAAAEVALLEALGLDAGSVVVELGTGTGQFTVEAARVAGRVIAVDVSEPMLERLEVKIAERSLQNVEVVRAGFLSYEHSGAAADFVYSRLALHHLPDFWKAVALHRIRRILRPGGIFRLWDAVYDFDPPQAEERIEAWCAAYEGGGEGEWTRADIEEHVRDEHSTFSWLLEATIERCGFAIDAAEHSPDAVLASYVLRAV